MTIQATASLGLLLIAPLNATLFLSNPCLSKNFYGLVKDAQTTSSLFKLTTPECIQAATNNLISQEPHVLIAAPSNGQRLVWIEQESVEESLLERDQEARNIALVDVFGTRPGPLYANQESLSSGQIPQSQILYNTDTSLLVSLPLEDALQVDQRLPRFWKSTLIPDTPTTYRASDSNVARVRETLATLKFDPVIASVVNNISKPQIRSDIHFLTGEDGESGIISRHSFSKGALVASQWIKDRIEETGAKCRFEYFLEGFSPSVICRYPSLIETDDTIIISGHYDSRGSFGSLRAPGGDDDGSGTTGILSIARTIARKGVQFYSNVELCTFAGEEQGLLGSRAYARQLRAQNASVVLMIQADMTAYRAPEEPMQLGLPATIGTPEVTDLVAKISALYSPELTVGYSSACCSDHQSFIEQGFPATQVFERAGPIADPMYHNSGDLSEREGYDFDQLFAIAKVQFASVLHVAGFELESN